MKKLVNRKYQEVEEGDLALCAGLKLLERAGLGELA
jgi:hypothetical protein